MYAPWMQSHQSHRVCKTAQKAPVDSLVLFVCFKGKTEQPEELLPWRSPWGCSEERRFPATAGWDRQEILDFMRLVFSSLNDSMIQPRNKTVKMLWGAYSRPTGRPQRCCKGSLGPQRTVEICSSAEHHCVLETNIIIWNLQGLVGRDQAVNKPFLCKFSLFKELINWDD